MHDFALEDIREWLRQLCRQHQVTVSEIARKSGLSESTLTRLMDDGVGGTTPRLSTIQKIERAFQVSAPLHFRANSRGVREERQNFINLQIDEELVHEARELKIDVGDVTRRALETVVRRARMQQWVEENRAVLEAKAKRVEEEGLWSDGLRQF